MSKKGGYLIIDLKNKDLLQLTNELFTQTELKEIYESIEHNYHKYALVSGIVIYNIEKNDYITNIYYSNNAYHFKVHGLIITLSLSEGNYLIKLDDDLIHISGRSDSEGIVKINYCDFPYRYNLLLLFDFGGTIYQVSFSAINGATATGNSLLYYDDRHTIALSASDPEYFEIFFTSALGDAKNANYDLYYLG